MMRIEQYNQQIDSSNHKYILYIYIIICIYLFIYLYNGSHTNQRHLHTIYSVIGNYS